MGHAVVVHESGGTRAACGLLGEGQEYVATMGEYPDYEGNFSLEGYIVVAEEQAGSSKIRVTYSLSGLEASTSGELLEMRNLSADLFDTVWTRCTV